LLQVLDRDVPGASSEKDSGQGEARNDDVDEEVNVTHDDVDEEGNVTHDDVDEEGNDVTNDVINATNDGEAVEVIEESRVDDRAA
jgi:hypothetical protein